MKVSKSADETSAFERAKKESEAMERELTTLTAARNVPVFNGYCIIVYHLFCFQLYH